MSAVPLGNRRHEARRLDDVQSPEVGIFFTSCFKIGPYASAEHPQDVLGGHADDISLLSSTDKSCCQIKMGMVAYLGADHDMFNKTDTTCKQR